MEPYTHELFAAGAGGRLLLDGQVFGYLGLLSAAGMKRFELRHPAAVAEIRLSPLMEKALLVPQYHPLSMQPAIVRDINLVVDETRQWRDLENCIRQTAGNLLERLDYRDTYRDAERLGAGKKSWLVSLQLRHAEATLTSAEADALRDRIVVACRAALGAELRA